MWAMPFTSTLMPAPSPLGACRSTAQLRLRQLGDGEIQIRRGAVVEDPGGGETGKSEDPLEQSPALELRRGGDEAELARETAGEKRRLALGIAQQVGEVEAALAEEALRIDGEPATLAAVEDVAVVQVAVQYD